MSNERIPILSGAILSFEMFMSRWEKLITEHSHLKPLVQPGLDKAYEYYSRMDRTRAYIVAMCTYLDYFLKKTNDFIYSVKPVNSYVMDSKTLGSRVHLTGRGKDSANSKALSNICTRNLSLILYKMREYREKMRGTAGDPPTQTSNPLSTEDAPRYMSLADQYGIADEMEIGESSQTSQTIEQEYQAYITAALSLKTVDILKFWEVGR